MSEDIPACRIHEKHDWIVCSNAALSGDLDGLCLLHSLDKQKDIEGAFTAAVKEKLERKDNDFRGVFFPIKADFRGHEFQEQADFTLAIFSDVADFKGSTFFKSASFYATTFDQEANFNGVTIPENQEVHFRGTEFSEKREVIFRGANVFGRLIFEQINLPYDKTKNRSWYGDFIRVNLGPTAILRFRDTSLALVRFEGTDLNRIEFEGVEWYPLGWREAIYDEILLREKDMEHFSYVMSNTSYLADVLPQGLVLKDVRYLFYSAYPLVEGLYRKLKLNYEICGDHKNAGYFHYGEMEMYRRSDRWRPLPLSFCSIYWALSGYGERPVWALAWLVAFLTVFTGLLAWAGLEILEPKHSAGFGNSFFYLLQKVTLQRPTWAEPAGFFGKLVAGLSVLLIPGQAALFVLALRNRLGRRR